MEINEDYLHQLLAKMDALNYKQDSVQHDLNQLRREVEMVKRQLNFEKTSAPESSTPDLLKVPEIETLISPEPLNTEPSMESIPAQSPERPTAPPPKKALPPKKKSWTIQGDFEKFIGENLVSKIGILVLVLGAAIGGRYAINNNFINPLTRIILGYLLGTGMIVIAINLRKNYEKLSAVLISGAVTILYFMTYFAYDFYGLIPQAVAFGLMVVLTIFTVLASFHYNRQIIAVLGLVGSYAIPFLLSSGSGDRVFLFSYIAIINIGVMVISVRKYWKPLYYLAFIFTYGIFGFWVLNEGHSESQRSISFIFGIIYFSNFYAVFLGYKLWRLEKFLHSDVALVLLNAFAFYGLGYYVLSYSPNLTPLLGIFTLLNALIHFGVSSVIYNFRLSDKSLFYLISGLVLVFITIAVPVQFDGNWVPMIWLAEAVLLFWVARKQKIYFYEQMSYVGMVLSVGGLLLAWGDRQRESYFGVVEAVSPIFNSVFLLNIFFIIGFGGLNYLHYKTKENTDVKQKSITEFLSNSLPSIFTSILFLTFFMEISLFWTEGYNASGLVKNLDQETIKIPANPSYIKFKTVWLLIYSMLFFTAMSFINQRFIKERKIAAVSLSLMFFTIVLFITGGQWVLLDLWNSWIDRAQFPDYNRGIMHLLIRYLSIAVASGMIIMIAKIIKEFFDEEWLKISFTIGFHLSILAILSFELTGWMDMRDAVQPHRFGLSILWGVYALGLIGWGIYKENKYLRYLAFGVFGFTLLKFFMYDFAGLDTIGKTVVLISLGILLLIIPFLYKKYENAIS